ncbi:HUS1 checkpoint protein [Trichoderma cornu-damae]|uniref:Checkpoint protein n=1 Tax=Trichoderma cornu-damae TaxID=654480 RepID=A0A9P8QYY7_9HYPO|nr:HUS1 checkpoint protein [Trichoderma cornu-damae]
MRFNSDLKNIRTFAKLTAAFSALEKLVWLRLSNEIAHFTVVPDTGSQIWSTLPMDFLFENYQIQSTEPTNTINLELSLQPLHRALKSAQNSTSASLRLTKRNGVPVLSMKITATTSKASHANAPAPSRPSHDDPFGDDDDFQSEHRETSLRREHEKIITQDIPVRVLHPIAVGSTVQPTLREPDVHIQLPPLLQLKSISDRFTKLALASNGSNKSPRLEISANMHGGLRVRIATETADISSAWTDLTNPELNSAQLRTSIEDHPSTKFRHRGPDSWASIYVDGKDWSRVLSAGRLEGRVIACFCHNHSLVLYVYMPHYDDAERDDAADAVLVYHVQAYSA